MEGGFGAVQKQPEMVFSPDKVRLYQAVVIYGQLYNRRMCVWLVGKALEVFLPVHLPAYAVFALAYVFHVLFYQKAQQIYRVSLCEYSYAGYRNGRCGDRKYMCAVL